MRRLWRLTVLALMVTASFGLTAEPAPVSLTLDGPLRAPAPRAGDAGFLNARGAVRLAERFGGSPARMDDPPDEGTWGRHLIWGNHRVGGGLIRPEATAWSRDVVWGAALTPRGQQVVWGIRCADSCAERDGTDDVVPWGTTRPAVPVVLGREGDDENVVWGTAEPGDRVLWAGGRVDGGWGTRQSDGVVWSNLREGDNALWDRRDAVRGVR